MNGKKLFGWTLMILGLMALLVAGGLGVSNHMENEEAEAASAQVLNQMAAFQQSNADSAVIEGNEYIGALFFPSLNLRVPVMSTISDAQLMVAPCRQAGSVTEGGLVIAGHNFVNQFGRLDRLCINENVFFTDMKGNVTHYNVQKIELVPGDDSAYMLDPTWDMSLYTCDYSGNQRLTLRCERVK